MAILAREMGFDWLVLRRGLFEGCVENVRHGTTSSGRGLTYNERATQNAVYAGPVVVS